MDKTKLLFYITSGGAVVSSTVPDINQYANNIDIYVATLLPTNSIVQLIIRPSTFTDQTLPARYMSFVDETIVLNGQTFRGVYKYSLSQEDTSIAPLAVNTMHFAFNFYDNESHLIATVAEQPIVIKKTNAVKTQIAQISATDTLSSAINVLSANMIDKSNIYFTEKSIALNDTIEDNGYYLSFMPNEIPSNTIGFSGNNSIVVSQLNNLYTIEWINNVSIIAYKTVTDIQAEKIPLSYFTNYKTLSVVINNSSFKWLIAHDCESNYKNITDIISGDTTVVSAITSQTLNGKQESELSVDNALKDNLGNTIHTTYSKISDLAIHNSSVNAHSDIRHDIETETTARINGDGNLLVAIQNEALNRQSADSSLQEQITSINNRSDVVDIVSNIESLLTYNTSNLTLNDKIKVLNYTQPTPYGITNVSAYFSWRGTSTGSLSDWSFIGIDAQQTNVMIGGVKANTVVFDTDPQTQLNNRYTKNETDDKIIDNYGKEIQLDFNATLISNNIVGTLEQSIADYELVSGTSYLFHIHLPLTTLTGDLNNSYGIYLNDKHNNTVNINCVFQKNIELTSTVGDLCQLQDYNVTDGYSWEFNGYYKQIGLSRFIYVDTIVRESNPSMTGTDIHNAVANSSLKPGTTVLCTEDYLTSYKKGTSYKIVGEWIDSELIIDTEALHDNDKQDNITSSQFANNATLTLEDNHEYYGSEYISALNLSATFINSQEAAMVCFTTPQSGNVSFSYTTMFKFSGTDCENNLFIPLNGKYYRLLFHMDNTSGSVIYRCEVFGTEE